VRLFDKLPGQIGTTQLPSKEMKADPPEAEATKLNIEQKVDYIIIKS
jgi:hypothetical protein